MESWFSIKAAVLRSSGEAEILVYDMIGAGGVGVDEFNRALKSLGDAKDISLRINSPGGDGFAGLACYNVLAAHPANITCHVDGLAAGPSSLLVMAADKIIAPENAFVAVHNPIAMTIGPADVHYAVAADLARLTDAYAGTYSARTKQPLAAVKALMGQDRLMSAKEAKSLGYVDQVADGAELIATFDLAKLQPRHKAAAAAFSIKADWRAAHERARRERGIVRH